MREGSNNINSNYRPYLICRALGNDANIRWTFEFCEYIVQYLTTPFLRIEVKYDYITPYIEAIKVELLERDLGIKQRLKLPKRKKI